MKSRIVLRGPRDVECDNVCCIRKVVEMAVQNNSNIASGVTTAQLAAPAVGTNPTTRLQAQRVQARAHNIPAPLSGPLSAAAKTAATAAAAAAAVGRAINVPKVVAITTAAAVCNVDKKKKAIKATTTKQQQPKRQKKTRKRSTTASTPRKKSSLDSFTCDQCGKVFTRQANLRRHIKLIHLGIKEYACTEPGCTQQFPRRSDLNAHLRMHKGERPFVCQYEGCGKSFRRRSDCLVHERRHEKPHKCPLCPGIGYARRNDLRQHFLARHKDHPMPPSTSTRRNKNSRLGGGGAAAAGNSCSEAAMTTTARATARTATTDQGREMGLTWDAAATIAKDCSSNSGNSGSVDLDIAAATALADLSQPGFGGATGSWSRHDPVRGDGGGGGGGSGGGGSGGGGHGIYLADDGDAAAAAAGAMAAAKTDTRRHTHNHGLGCGHKIVLHNDHLDFLLDDGTLFHALSDGGKPEHHFLGSDDVLLPPEALPSFCTHVTSRHSTSPPPPINRVGSLSGELTHLGPYTPVGRERPSSFLSSSGGGGGGGDCLTHSHQHGPNCGHPIIQHNGHTDYLMDGGLLDGHDGCNMHGMLGVFENPPGTTVLHLKEQLKKMPVALDLDLSTLPQLEQL